MEKEAVENENVIEKNEKIESQKLKDKENEKEKKENEKEKKEKEKENEKLNDPLGVKRPPLIQNFSLTKDDEETMDSWAFMATMFGMMGLMMRVTRHISMRIQNSLSNPLFLLLLQKVSNFRLAIVGMRNHFCC